MTSRRDVSPTRDPARCALPLLVASACLLWAPPAPAGECGSPCTVTADSFPNLQIRDSSASGVDWAIRTVTDGDVFQILDIDGDERPVTIERGAGDGLLHLDTMGRIGVNTTAPTATLQINSTFPSIRLNNTSSGAGHADLLMGGTLFHLLGTSGQGVLQISTEAPPISLRVNPNGRVGLGVATPDAKLHVDGDARIEGDVVLASSRTLKTDFDPVSSREILARVADLPLASWRYRSEDPTARHIGPFAEDFQRLFGLGDGETISIVDAQGVALAAIQGLEQRLAEVEAAWERGLAAKDAELERLRSERNARISELTARFAAQHAELTARLAAIEGRAPGGTP